MTATGPASLAPRRRSMFRVSLRVFLALIVALAAWLGWLVHRARVQREAVAAIEKAGGWVFYDWRFRGGHHKGSSVEGGPWAPKWLVETLGPDLFGDVIVADLNAGGTDEVYRQVGRLDRLQRLSVCGNVSDVSMRHLAGLPWLENLHLGSALIRNDSLVHLHRLPRLTDLALPSYLDDEGFAALEGMRSLRNVYFLGGAPYVSKEALAKLKRNRPDLVIQGQVGREPSR